MYFHALDSPSIQVLTPQPFPYPIFFLIKIAQHKSELKASAANSERIEAEPAHLSEYHYLGQARRGKSKSSKWEGGPGQVIPIKSKPIAELKRRNVQ